MCYCRVALMTAIVALSLVLAATPGHAGEYSFPRVEIDAEVLSDGSLVVMEERTIHFSGSFQGMYHWIPITGQTEIVDISVSEGDTPYKFNPELQEGPAGTFYVIQRPDDTVYIDWSFHATDETRTFTLSYRMLNVVTVHEDVAEINHQFVGDEWERATDEVVVRLLLPEGADRDEIRAWGHAPPHGEVTIVGPGEVTWEISPLPAETCMEGRVVFPRHLVPDASVLSGQEALPGILAEEQALAEAADRRRALASMDRIAAPVILLLALIAVLWFWSTYGREFDSPFTGEYHHELPADYTPAELGVLCRFDRPGPEDLTATIVDLARRGHLKIEESQQEEQTPVRTIQNTVYLIQRLAGNDDLEPHEQSLVDFLFTQVPGDDDDEISFKDIYSYARILPEAFARFWDSWKSQLVEVSEVRGFFDITTRKARTVEFTLAGLLFVVGVLAFMAGLLPTGIGSVVGGAALGIGGMFLRRRSREGLEDFKRWQAFRRFLLHCSEMKHQETHSLAICEHYLPYAVTLGVKKEFLRQIEIAYPDLRDGSYHFGLGWYVCDARHASMEQVTSGLDNLGMYVRDSLRAAGGSSFMGLWGAGSGGRFSGSGGMRARGGGGGVR